MIRQHLARGQRVEKNGFRWRGAEVGRIEALSDAVFGFAITLLVVSLEVPGTFSELLRTLRGLPAFAASFAILFLVWLNHYRFFRRYGLEDAITITLNAVLLFVILFFVYPLKFVFQLVMAMMLGPEWLPVTRPGQGPIVATGEGGLMMIIFGAGYVAVFLIFSLLHVNAWRLRNELELDEMERFDTLDKMREALLNVAVGTASITVIAAGGSPWMAGMVYWSIGPVMAAHGFWAGARRKRLRTRVAATAPAVALAGD